MHKKYRTYTEEFKLECVGVVEGQRQERGAERAPTLHHVLWMTTAKSPRCAFTAAWHRHAADDHTDLHALAHAAPDQRVRDHDSALRSWENSGEFRATSEIRRQEAREGKTWCSWRFASIFISLWWR